MNTHPRSTSWIKRGQTQENCLTLRKGSLSALQISALSNSFHIIVHKERLPKSEGIKCPWEGPKKQRLNSYSPLHKNTILFHFPLEALSSAEKLSKNPHQRLATNLKEKEGQQVRVIYILLVVSELSWVFKKVSKEPRMLVAGGNWREAWGWGIREDLFTNSEQTPLFWI